MMNHKDDLIDPLMLNPLVLIPAYNESEHIGKVIQMAPPGLPVLVVDDGSKDDTSTIARSSGAVVLVQNPNQGKGAALRRGLAWALEQGFTEIITLDADGQHDPAEIPLFLEARRKTGADMIIGARQFAQMPFIRRLANTSGGLLFSWAMRHPIRDNQSGYRLLSQRMAQSVLESDEQGFEYEVEMIVRCLKNNYTLDWVPIRTIYGDEKSHIQPFRHAWKFLTLVFKTRRATRRKEA